jgi:hypothetical protein
MLAEAAQVAGPSINKWQERVDAFVKGVLFSAGKMAGENRLQTGGRMQTNP